MASINPLAQSLFINQQMPGKSALPVNNEQQKANKTAITIEADFVQIGSSEVIAQADELFARANSYSKLVEDYSPKVQQSLQAYAALDVANKRDEISRLMGVDLYA